MNNSEKRSASAPLVTQPQAYSRSVLSLLSEGSPNSESSKQTQHTLGKCPFFPELKLVLEG